MRKMLLIALLIFLSSPSWLIRAQEIDIGDVGKDTMTTETQAKPTAKSGTPQRWLLAIGISEFADKRIGRLKFCTDDAVRLSEYFKKEGVPSTNRILLLNPNATRDGILQALGRVAQHIGKQDTFFFFYSSHGGGDKKTGRTFFVTYDTDAANPQGTALSMQYVKQFIQKLVCRDVVVMIDTCHSGGIKTVDSSGADGNLSLNEVAMLNLEGQWLQVKELEGFVSMATAQTRIAVLTSCRTNEYSLEKSEWGHGAFTYSILQGLSGKADFLPKDGDVNVSELINYVQQEVPRATQHDQHPTGSFSYNWPKPKREKGVRVGKVLPTVFALTSRATITPEKSQTPEKKPTPVLANIDLLPGKSPSSFNPKTKVGLDEQPKPEMVSSPKPEMVSSPKPEVVSSPKPEVVNPPKPEVVNPPKPEVISPPKPELTEQFTPTRPSASPKPETTTSWKPSNNTPGRNWLLTIGLCKFADPSISSLRYCVRDATAIARYFKGVGVADSQIILLCDQQATTKNIINALIALKKTIQPQDTFYFFYASHGGGNLQSNVTYFVSYDTNLRQPERTGLLMQTVKRAVQSFRCRNAVMMVDTCFSGGSKSWRDSQLPGSWQHLKSIRDFARTNQSGTRIAVLTACRANEVSLERPEWGGGHGVFTYYLMNGLAGKADSLPKDGYVSVTELFDYVQEAVPRDPLVRRSQHPTGSLSHNWPNRNHPNPAMRKNVIIGAAKIVGEPAPARNVTYRASRPAPTPEMRDIKTSTPIEPRSSQRPRTPHVKPDSLDFDDTASDNLGENPEHVGRVYPSGGYLLYFYYFGECMPTAFDAVSALRDENLRIVKTSRPNDQSMAINVSWPGSAYELAKQLQKMCYRYGLKVSFRIKGQKIIFAKE